MLPPPTEHAPRLWGPRPGDAVETVLCCWRCDAILTGHGLPRLRLCYGIWKHSFAELLGVEPPRDSSGAPNQGPLDACRHCGAEQDWLAYLRAAPELYRLAAEADESGDSKQAKLAPWFSPRRLYSATPYQGPLGIADAVRLAETIDEICGSDDAGFRRLMRTEMKNLRRFVRSSP